MDGLRMDGSGACLSACRRYRVDLWRIWDSAKPYVAFVLLNPSTADETQDDPTARKCRGYARRWGFGGFHIVNLFPYRATRPAELLKLRFDELAGTGIHGDFEGAAVDVCKRAGLVVVGWGRYGDKCFGQGTIFAARLQANAVRLWCFGINKDGTPVHPLYQANDKQLIEYRAEKRLMLCKEP